MWTLQLRSRNEGAILTSNHILCYTITIIMFQATTSPLGICETNVAGSGVCCSYKSVFIFIILIPQLNLESVFKRVCENNVKVVFPCMVDKSVSRVNWYRYNSECGHHLRRITDAMFICFLLISFFCDKYRFDNESVYKYLIRSYLWKKWLPLY